MTPSPAMRTSPVCAAVFGPPLAPRSGDGEEWLKRTRQASSLPTSSPPLPCYAAPEGGYAIAIVSTCHPDRATCGFAFHPKSKLAAPMWPNTAECELALSPQEDLEQAEAQCDWA